MLTQLTVHGFAIIDSLDIEFSPGMTILTGETGAGKSILIDALTLTLGGRASTADIAVDAPRCEVIACFAPEDDSPAREWLADKELESADGECIMRRTLSRDGRSRGYINGRPFPVQTLRELGAMLVEIHGQHAHQSLTQRDAQRAMLDNFANAGALLTRIAKAHKETLTLDQEIASVPGGAESDTKLEFLRFQAAELEALALEENEWDAIQAEHKRLHRADETQHAVRSVLQSLDDGQGVGILAGLSEGLSKIADARSADTKLANVAELLESALIGSREAEAELRSYRDNLEADEGALDRIETRMASLHDMARKHRVNPQDLPKQLAKLHTEIASIENAAHTLAELTQRKTTLMKTYRTASAELHKARAKAAKTFAKSVSANMHELGMEGGRLEVLVTSRDEPEPTPHGDDTVEFRVSTNPDAPAQPLARVASGGELSRISLAIQVLDAARRPIPSLIFDEVDVGVGGRTAEIVGQQLNTLAKRYQVLCVTHLPQVASKGDHHLQVEKKAVSGKTRARLTRLSKEQRVREIARMLAGVRVSKQALEHAKEMLGS